MQKITIKYSNYISCKDTLPVEVPLQPVRSALTDVSIFV